MNAKLEKIARMEGKTTYKDFRQGFASASLAGDSDADIKMALGMAQRQVGALAVQVLETRYASTLKHERALRRAWDRHCKDMAKIGGGTRGRAERHSIAMERLAAALAIRHLAGAKVAKPDVEEWAWVICAGQDSLASLVRTCGAWLDDLCSGAERVFLESLDAIRPQRSRRREEA